MVITRTPFRISFFGGGTDYPQWYLENGGKVISTSINQYCYITLRYLPPFFDYKHRIRYTLREEVSSIDKIQHPVVREYLKISGIQQGIEMVHTSDLPTRSGIGSSSAFSVGFIHSVHALRHCSLSKVDLAKEAIWLEQSVLNETVGSQDQVATAFGGLNVIEFLQNGQFTVQPLPIDSARILELQSHLMLFFTGFQRTASEIAKDQVDHIPDHKSELTRMAELTEQAISQLCSPTFSIESFGRLLHDQWVLKKSLSQRISTSQIDNIYESTRKAGAWGGKLCGAGGGGFLLVCADPVVQPAIREALRSLIHIPFQFDTFGSQLIFYSPEFPIEKRMISAEELAFKRMSSQFSAQSQ